MNIGIFTDTYFPQINGVATSTALLKAELEHRGHKVFIFTTTDPQAKQKVPSVFRLPSMPFVFLPTHRMAYMYSPKLILNLKKFKLDIVHTQTEFSVGIFGKVVSEILKIPHVHTYHTMYEDYVHYVAHGHIITPNMAKSYSRFFCNRARAVITPVEKTKKSLLEYGVKRPIAIIPTGLDFSVFKRGKYSDEEINDVKTEYGIDVLAPIIVYVGRVAQEKSIDVIFNAMPSVLEEIPNAQLVVVGNGPLIEELTKLAQTLNIEKSVFFLGGKPWTEIGKYYQLGDVFTTASTSETQGLTYLEAMAAKVLVVAKADESVNDVIIHGETGFLFETDEQLPKLLIDALANKEQSKKIAETAFETIQRLSVEHFGESVERLYIEVLEKSRIRKEKKLFSLKPFNKKEKPTQP